MELGAILETDDMSKTLRATLCVAAHKEENDLKRHVSWARKERRWMWHVEDEINRMRSE